MAIVLAMFLAAGCAVTPPQHAASKKYHFEGAWISLDRWATARGFQPAEQLSLEPLTMTITNGFQWEDRNLKAKTSLIPLPTFLWRAGGHELTIQPHTRTAYWDKIQIHLGFTPKIIQGEPWLHKLDLKKTIKPLLYPAILPDTTNRVIVIDPGNDNDSAANDFALDWAQRLTPLLKHDGWRVFLTRTNASISRAARTAVADLYHPDLFLNLDFNADRTNKNLSGVEAICMTPVGIPSNIPTSAWEDTWRKFPNNAFDVQNWQYAFRLYSALTQIPGTEERGLRRLRFIHLLAERPYPAVRISGGFLTNPHDAALIENPTFRQKLAEAVASALK